MSETLLQLQFAEYALCVCLSGFVRAITSTFMHGFQNNSAQLSVVLPKE